METEETGWRFGGVDWSHRGARSWGGGNDKRWVSLFRLVGRKFQERTGGVGAEVG